MTQEHLQTLIERAVEKANADNNADEFIRVHAKFEPTERTDMIAGKISVYERPHYFQMMQTANKMTGTTEYKFASEFDNATHNIPKHADKTLSDTETANQLVNTVYKLIESKRLEIYDIGPTPTQQRIANNVNAMWNNIKRTHGNTDWVLKQQVTGDPNKVYFHMDLGHNQSTAVIGRYEVDDATHVSIETKNQPLRHYSSVVDGSLGDIVYGVLEQEVEILNERIIDDIPTHQRGLSK